MYNAEAHSFWIHTNSGPISDDLLVQEIPRRRYVVLNAWEYRYIPRIKELNADCLVFCYKDLSSVRSYDNNPDVRMLPAGISYGYAKTRSDWWAKDSSGKWLQYDGYSGHYQMDVGKPGYQNAWATNVSKMKALGFDGIWMDNALWFRDTYHPGVPVAGYTTDGAWREAYRSFFRYVCPRLHDAGLLCVANMSDARRVAGGWKSYLDAGLDGGFDEWWLIFNDSNMLPEYTEGWRRVVDEIAYAESQGKIALVQPHFSPGNEHAFDYALASYFMAYPNGAGKAAIAELAVTDGYEDPPIWHPEYDWELGAPSGPYRQIGANLFRRDFSDGVAVVNANRYGTAAVTIDLGGRYYDEYGNATRYVRLGGTSGKILRVAL